MSVTKDQILQALRGVNDLSLGRDIVDLGMVENVAVCESHVSVRLARPDAGEDDLKQLAAQVHRAVRTLGSGLENIQVEWGGKFDAAAASASASKPASGKPAATAAAPAGTASTSNALPHVGRVVAVGAGKGGVGKSTVSVNLAVGLARRGLRVGLLDGDIYGPSVPTLMGLGEQPPRAEGQTIHPFEAHGIKTITMGRLVAPDKPLIWRGPMAHGAFRQLALQTAWGELDHLIVDLPPGTGDVPLSLAQMLPLAGAVIVCTPQKVAQDDAVRAVGMFGQLGVPVLGVVENMSYFVGDDGKTYDLFGRGGAAQMAERLGLPVLGTVPIDTALRTNSDAGDPTANFEAGGTLAQELEKLVDGYLQAVESTGPTRPTLNIS